MNKDATVFYDDKGQAIMVQMTLNAYEELVNSAKSAIVAKDKIEKTLNILKGL